MAITTLSGWQIERVFFHPVDTITYPDYATAIVRPLCLETIRRTINETSYCDVSFSGFVSDVELVFRNCREYTRGKEGFEVLHNTAVEMLVTLARLVDDFVTGYVDAAYKKYGRGNLKPNETSVLLNKARDDERIKGLFKSAGTLICVPNELMEHWRFQVRRAKEGERGTSNLLSCVRVADTLSLLQITEHLDFEYVRNLYGGMWGRGAGEDKGEVCVYVHTGGKEGKKRLTVSRWLCARGCWMVQ